MFNDRSLIKHCRSSLFPRLHIRNRSSFVAIGLSSSDRLLPSGDVPSRSCSAAGSRGFRVSGCSFGRGSSAVAWTMTGRPSTCAIFKNLNLASICMACVNYRLNDYNNGLKSLKSSRDALYSRLSEVLVAKGKADDQFNWRVRQNEKLAKLREKLRRKKEQLVQGKAKVERLSNELKAKYGELDSALSKLGTNRVEQLEKFYPNLVCTQTLGFMAITSERLHKQSVVIKQICKLFPQSRVNVDGERKDGSIGQFDQICNARLPRGFDPHSVPSEELGASLGLFYGYDKKLAKILLF